MDELAALLVFGAAGAAWLTSWWRGEQDNRRAILARLLGRLQGTLAPGAFADEVVGAHEGRPFRLRLRSRWGYARRLVGSLVTRVYPIRVDVDLLHAPAVRLRIRRDQGLAAVEKSLRLVRDVEVAGGDRFDRDYLVEADGEAAATPLASRQVREAVEHLLRRWPLDELSIRAGKLVVRGAPDTVGLRELGGLLDALHVLARAYDRRPGDELGLAGRFVWVGGRDVQPRCPYCHDALDDGLALVSCASCRTVLHQDCHAENHGCPLLGCGGRAADWARGAGAKKDEATSFEGENPGEGRPPAFSDEGPVDLDLRPEGAPLVDEPVELALPPEPAPDAGSGGADLERSPGGSSTDRADASAPLPDGYGPPT